VNYKSLTVRRVRLSHRRLSIHQGYEPSGAFSLLVTPKGSLGMFKFMIIDYFVIGEAIGIIGALFVEFYYSRRQMQNLSIDVESKILNDIGDKLNRLSEAVV